MTQEQRDRDFQNRFGYHRPTSDEIAQRHTKIRESCQWLATIVDSYVPDCREREISLRKIEEAMFWANAGIARVANYNGERRPGHP